MICNSKTEFLTNLRIALENNNVADRSDILSDFRQHFEDGAAAGESEADVCRKLGDIDEIIKQYISEQSDAASTPTGGAMPDTSGFEAQSGEQPYSQPRYVAPQPQQFTPSAGKIVGILCLDTFVYSWALPALAGIIVGLIGVTISFITTGIISLIGGTAGLFIDISGLISTGFASISLLFFGIMISALGGMLVIASIASVKGFINIIIAIINHHANIFTGHKVLNKIGKKKEAVQ